MKLESSHHEMMPISEFAGVCGANDTDVRFYKEHVSFLSEFRIGTSIPKGIVEVYLRNRGYGILISETTERLYKPTACCKSGSKIICRSGWQETKLLAVVSRLEELIHPVPEGLIWHDLFIQTDNCYLKNYYEYRYLLFHLKDTGRLIKVLDAEGEAAYSVSLVPVKRGPGRPRKHY